MNAKDDTQDGDGSADIEPASNAEESTKRLTEERAALTINKMRLLLSQQERRIAGQNRAHDSVRTRASLLISASAITTLLRSTTVDSVWALLAIIAGLLAAFIGIYGLRRVRRKGFDPDGATSFVSNYKESEVKFMRRIFASEQEGFKEYESKLATDSRVVQIGFVSLAFSMAFAFISLLDQLI